MLGFRARGRAALGLREALLEQPAASPVCPKCTDGTGRYGPFLFLYPKCIRRTQLLN